MRKGTYEIAIMQLLQEKDMYGYDISASLKEIYDYSISPGAIYPIMKRLEESEWIESYWKKSNEGPNRKYYVLTKKGEVALKERNNKFIELFNRLNLVKEDEGLVDDES